MASSATCRWPEELAQDPFVAALEQWPESGIPDEPGDWRMTAAKRRTIDALRRRVTLDRKRELIGRVWQTRQQLDQPDLASQVDDVHGRRLGLVFVPTATEDARVAAGSRGA